MRLRRVKLRTITVLVILQGAVLVLLCIWSTSTDPEPPSKNRKVHVLLLSTYRSGSSFMGEVFNQHPDVFYLMEPANHVWRGLNSVGAKRLQIAVREFLWNIFQCDFSMMDFYMLQPDRMSSLFFWWRSRALCSPPACALTPRNEFSNETVCFRVCGKKDLRLVEDTCKTYSHVVIKEVRVLDLESLYPLLRDPMLDLRIIHLVRDPRAVLQSRTGVSGALLPEGKIILEHRDIPESEFQLEFMKQICLSHSNIINSAFLNPPSFLKGSYILVRYEDIARNPLEEIRHLYDFAGLKMTAKLKDWIHSLTRGKNMRNHPFSVASRNASSVAWAWRNKLPHDQVRRVQEECRWAMKLLGYRTVRSEEEQKNLHVNLLMPKSNIMNYIKDMGKI